MLIEKRRRELILNKVEFFLNIRKCMCVLDIWKLLRVVGIVVVIIFVVYGLLFFCIDILICFVICYLKMIYKNLLIKDV